MTCYQALIINTIDSHQPHSCWMINTRQTTFRHALVQGAFASLLPANIDFIFYYCMDYILIETYETTQQQSAGIIDLSRYTESN